MQQLARAEQHGKEMSALMKKDFELSEGEKSQKIKDMEKSQRQWKQEKDELVRVRLDHTILIAVHLITSPLFAGDDRHAREAAIAIQRIKRRHRAT